MDTALFVVGGVALLLLFGCAGLKEKAAEPKPSPQPPQPPVAKPPGGTLGDRDLATQDGGDEDALADEDILIPPDDSGILLEEDDIFIDEETESDAISEEDILLP